MLSRGSRALELRRTFYQKGPPSFLKILAIKRRYSQGALGRRESLEGWVVEHCLEDLLVHPVYHRCQSGNVARHGIGKIFHLVQWYDVLHQANAERFTRRDNLGREQEFHSFGRADEADHPTHLTKADWQTQAGDWDTK